MKKGNCSRLLDDTLVSFYWLGFLLADGHFSSKNRITVSLSIKDLEHLRKLADFLDTEVKYATVKLQDREHDQCKISVMHTSVIEKLKKKYNIQSNKTENPPNLESLSEEQLFACSIGFLDGDGSIGYQYQRKDCIIRIKCHSSWSNVLKNMYPSFSHSITTDGYAGSNLSNSIIIKDIKRKCIKLGLPTLNRKWDKIDLKLVGRTEISEDRKKNIHELLKQDYSILEICKILNLKYSTVYMIIKRNKL